MGYELPTMQFDWGTITEWGLPFGRSDYPSAKGKSRTYQIWYEGGGGYGVGLLQNRMVQTGTVISNSKGLTHYLKYHATATLTMWGPVSEENPDGQTKFTETITSETFINEDGLLDSRTETVGDIPLPPIGYGYGDVWTETDRIDHTVGYQQGMGDNYTQRTHSGSSLLSGVVTQDWLQGAADRVHGDPDGALVGYFSPAATKGETYGPVSSSTFYIDGYDISGLVSPGGYPWNNPFKVNVLLVTRNNLARMGGYDTQTRIDPRTGGNIPGTRRTQLSEPINENQFRDDFGIFDPASCLDPLSWEVGRGLDVLITDEPPPDPPLVYAEEARGRFLSFTGKTYRITIAKIESDPGGSPELVNSTVVTVDGIAGAELGRFPYVAPAESSNHFHLFVSKVEQSTESGWLDIPLGDLYESSDMQGNPEGAKLEWHDAINGGWLDNPAYEAIVSIADWINATPYASGAKVKSAGTIYTCVQGHTSSPLSEPGSDGSYEFWSAVPKFFYKDGIMGDDPRVHILTFLAKWRAGSRWGFRGYGVDGGVSSTWYRKKSHVVDRSI